MVKIREKSYSAWTEEGERNHFAIQQFWNEPRRKESILKQSQNILYNKSLTSKGKKIYQSFNWLERREITQFQPSLACVILLEGKTKAKKHLLGSHPMDTGTLKN